MRLAWNIWGGPSVIDPWVLVTGRREEFQSERMTMEAEGCSEGGRGCEPGNAGGFQKLRKHGDGFSPKTSRRNAALQTP